MTVRSKAPLRLGLAGGGTDVSPYSDTYGGCVLNASIDMHAYTTIEPHPDGGLEFVAKDLEQSFSATTGSPVPLEGPLMLHKAVHARVVHDFLGGRRHLPVRVTTYSDAPPGSGLGTSSTLVVSILAAYQELLKLPLGDYDLAKLAYDIERKDCGLSGGKQDQYAATFGGVNFMEFSADDKVVINPLRIREPILNELHSRMLLYYTGQSRESARIIDDQIKAVSSDNRESVDSMHEVKRIAFEMKERLLKNDLDGVTELFRQSWVAKKKMAASISNADIERAAGIAMDAGAQAVKVSGAGGGGFMIILVDPTEKLDVQRGLAKSGGEFVRFNFVSQGVQTWAR
ncbi:MAG: dehydrogenase [Actinomycetota bacterium]|nr:dehydrogenase [Actinomycetota bacterium]